MATYRLKRKMFMLGTYAKDANGNLTRTGWTATGEGVSVANGAGKVTKNHNNNINQLIEKSQNTIKKDAANVARRQNALKSSNKLAFEAGKSKVGVMGGLKNTWAKAGTMGKAGMIAGGVAAAGLMAKGAASMLSGNNNNNQENQQ